MKKIKKEIVIVCPVHNEEDNIRFFINSFNSITNKLQHHYSFSYLFLDNCSEDKTLEILLGFKKIHKNISVIKYSRNFGVMKSIYTGIINVSKKASACLIFDCDLQDPPNLILDFLKKWEEGYKVVYGSREKRNESYFLTFMRKRYRNLEKFFKGYNVQIESGAWLLDKRIVEELRCSNYEPYLAGQISRLGFRSVGVFYNRNARKYGQTKFNFSKYFSYAIDSLVSGTIFPLRVSIFFGFIFSLFAFMLAIYFILAKLYFGVEFQAGIVASIVILLFGFGLNFIFLGLIGEYLGRVYLKDQSNSLAIIDKIYD